jgi:hypothetical protein
MASPSVTPRALANNTPPRGKLGLGMFGFGDLAALVSAWAGVAADGPDLGLRFTAVFSDAFSDIKRLRYSPLCFAPR